MSDEILKVGVSASGGELVVGSGLPKLLAMLFPGWAANLQIKNLAVQAIITKWQGGTPPTQYEVNWVAENVGESAARSLRQLQIANRAVYAIEAEAPKAPPAVPSDGTTVSDPAATARDWISKFWDDAGLVSDEMLQEVYARILASEATQPGTCSLRTLRTLRYMDRATADRFTAVLRAIMSSDFIPNDNELLKGLDIPYNAILDLDDAGLLDSSASIANTFARDQWYSRYGRWMIRAVDSKGATIPIYPLTKAGIQLARVAQVQKDEKDMLTLARWIGQKVGHTRVSCAVLPDAKATTFNANSLSWEPLVSPGEPPPAGGPLVL